MNMMKAMTSEQLITDNLDIWTQALKPKSSAGRGNGNNGKFELYGIKKLRELIFELASVGSFPGCEEQAETVELKNIVELVMGQAPPGSECNKDGSGTIFVKTGEFGQLYPEEVEWTTKPLKMAKKGDVLICVVGATVGKLNLGIDCAIGRSVAAIRPCAELSTKYLYYSLMPFTLKLRGSSRGSAQGVIGKSELNSVKIRFPSLAEQQKIVSKLDELMALCDQLEQQTETSLTAHQTLVETLLNTLANAPDNAKFEAAWQRIAEHFDSLFTTKHSIDQLKQTILQLAVMGKLVPQDPNDEPASELLKKIAAEKAKLVKEGKIKKQKTLPPVTDEEKPFDLPEGWIWAKLGEVGLCSTGKTPSTKEPKYYDGVIPFIGPGQITRNGELLNPDKFLSEIGIENSEEALPGDILMVCIGGSIGKVIVSNKRLAFNQQINSIRPLHTLPSFLHIAVSTDTFYSSVIAKATGSATPIINRAKWEELLIPICSESEQRRIVAKVDEIMVFCEQIKSQLKEAQITQLQLSDAITEQTLS